MIDELAAFGVVITNSSDRGLVDHISLEESTEFKGREVRRRRMSGSKELASYYVLIFVEPWRTCCDRQTQ